MKQYHDLLKYILENGQQKGDRTGTGTISCFSPPKMEFDIKCNIPVLTTKKMPWNNTVRELLWFISGSTNAYDLPKETQKWWTPWAEKDGSLGPIYGNLWRSWPYGERNIDQLLNVIQNIKKDPQSRRHIISTWHPGELHNQKLPPCHGLVIQFYVEKNDYLSCFVHQRSADLFIGLPVNLASYSLFTYMVAQVCNLKPCRLSYSIGDAHIYNNHINQVKEQLARNSFDLPKLWLNPEIKNIDNFKYEDIKLIDYKSHAIIKAPLAV